MISKEIFHKLINWLFIAFLVITIVSNYPPYFIKSPAIDAEVNYIDNSVYGDAEQICNNSLIITSGRPAVSIFFDVIPDYYLNTEYSEENWKSDAEYSLAFYDSNNMTYYDSTTKIPLIISLQNFNDIFAKNSRICYISGGLPYPWVNQKTREFIEKNFMLYKEYTSNIDATKMRLYLNKQ